MSKPATSTYTPRRLLTCGCTLFVHGAADITLSVCAKHLHDGDLVNRIAAAVEGS